MTRIQGHSCEHCRVDLRPETERTVIAGSACVAGPIH
jgi:predicted  nucleic acid-binding Zn-ribbon protein